MTDPRSRPATASQLLHTASEENEGEVMKELVPLVYDELCEMAHRQLANERAGHTLNTTALVHEAYLRLVGKTDLADRGRAYFFGAAVQAMRRVLIDHARKHKAKKRGGGLPALRLDSQDVSVDAFADRLIDLDNALTELAGMYPRQARVVECRFFGGLSIAETALTLDVSPRTVRYDWTLARARLYRVLRTDGR